MLKLVKDLLKFEYHFQRRKQRKRVSKVLRPGARVIDITAVREGWPDAFGEIICLDGSHAKILYDNTGSVRWKHLINLQIQPGKGITDE